MSLSFISDSIITTDVSIDSQIDLSLAEGITFDNIFNTDNLASSGAPDGAFAPIDAEHDFVENAFDHLDDAGVETEGQGVVTGGAGGFDFVVNVFDAEGNLQQINPLEDGFNLEAAEIAAIASAALENWGTFINGAEGAVIEVSLTVDQLAPGTVASAGATGFFFTEGGVDNFIDDNGNGVLDDGETIVIETNTALELQTGVDPVEGNFDLVINVNTDFLDLFSVDTVTFDPVTGEASVEFLDDVPDGTFDLFSVLSHEVGHGLGFLGLRSVLDGAGGGGTLPPFTAPNGAVATLGTLFDVFTEVDPTGSFATFDGPATLAAYGEPVLIETSTGSPGSDFSHFASDGDTALALLNPFVIPGERVDIGGLELAVFADLGFDVDVPADLPLINESDFFEPFRDLFPTIDPDNIEASVGTRGVTLSVIADVGSPFGGVPASVGVAAGDESGRGIFDVFGVPENNIADVTLSFDVLAPGIDLDTFVGVTSLLSEVSVQLFNPVNAGLLDDSNEATGTATLSDSSVTFTGDDDGDGFLLGNDGIDIIFGRDGDDVLFGGDGADALLGGAGNDVVVGGDGDDSIAGNLGDDDLFGGIGNDTITGGVGADNLDGQAGDDTLFGGVGDDILSGGDGDDTLSAGAGDDELLGGLGNDSLSGGSGNDELDGDRGDDTLSGGAGDDAIDGGVGADVLFGNAGADTIAGGAQEDFIAGGSGSDILNGGSGADTILGGGGADSVSGGTGDDILVGDGGGDSLSGGIGNDLLFGGSGRDSLTGGSGDDSLSGETGSDTLTGGAGNDIFTLSLGSSDDTVTDFTLDSDVVAITADLGAADFFDLVLTQDGSDTVVEVAGNSDDTLVLQNVNATDLDEFDFVFEFVEGVASLQADDAPTDGTSLSLSDTSSSPELLSLVSDFVGVADFGATASGDTEAFAFNADLIGLISAFDEVDQVSSSLGEFDFAYA